MMTSRSPLDRTVTYSPAFTLVPTYECFNRCDYCNFRVDPQTDPWMSLAEAEKILRSLQTTDTIEILILSGEVHPRSARRDAWVQHLYDLAQLALDLGFLPHTNAGPLSFDEMARLKQVNVSMGLMLEQLTPKLLETVHRHAPSKIPETRLRQLQWAGDLGIPFTTGLLLGIGETEQDWHETLEAIAQTHRTWGHIQEVILQPHSPGSHQADAGTAFDLERMADVVAIARRLLPDDICIQIPPNLVLHPELLLRCLDAGARDLGGIGPRDEVNPDYPHLHKAQLKKILHLAEWTLSPRLPVYSHYEANLSPALAAALKRVSL
ncbi:MAG: 7,8-didemethyl-8-hydroxy-5-deazariboflavin synthase subunit CofG [Elainellaceae cyanobacterium]